MMPEPKAMNVAIFLDDVNQYNGPLMFIPRSDKRGFIRTGHDLTTKSYPLLTIDNQLIRQLVEKAGFIEGGIVSPQGPASSMILFFMDAWSTVPQVTFPLEIVSACI